MKTILETAFEKETDRVLAIMERRPEREAPDPEVIRTAIRKARAAAIFQAQREKAQRQCQTLLACFASACGAVGVVAALMGMWQEAFVCSVMVLCCTASANLQK